MTDEEARVEEDVSAQESETASPKRRKRHWCCILPAAAVVTVVIVLAIALPDIGSLRDMLPFGPAPAEELTLEKLQRVLENGEVSELTIHQSGRTCTGRFMGGYANTSMESLTLNFRVTLPVRWADMPDKEKQAILSAAEKRGVKVIFKE